jgi:hypothetical protein
MRPSTLATKEANMRKPIGWLDPQQRHDKALQVPKPDQLADPARLDASLQRKIGQSMQPPQFAIFDPIASAMKRHPTLTSEEAAEMAKDFGF